MTRHPPNSTSYNMKGIVGAVILLVAVAAASAEVTSNDITAFDYHRRFGIPEAARIKQAEQEGLRTGAERIVGGIDTDITHTPYKVGVLINILVIFTSVCGASMVSMNRAIFAAHCSDDGVFQTRTFTLVFGSNTLFIGGTRVDTTTTAVHPGWNPATSENDIAMLFFPAVQLSPAIQPINLPSIDDAHQDLVGQIALASGYGLKNDDDSIGFLQRLGSVELPIISNAECASVYGSDFVHSSNMCTSGADGKGTCQGDSGGPLAITRDGVPVLVGVTSYVAAAGCEAGFPTAYARVTSFLPFIQSLM